MKLNHDIGFTDKTNLVYIERESSQFHKRIDIFNYKEKLRSNRLNDEHF